MRSSIVVQVLHNLIYLFLFTCFFFLFEVFLFFLRFFFFLVGFTTILGPASSVGSSVPIMLGTHLFRVKYHICVESCAAAAAEAPAAAARRRFRLNRSDILDLGWGFSPPFGNVKVQFQWSRSVGELQVSCNKSVPQSFALYHIAKNEVRPTGIVATFEDHPGTDVVTLVLSPTPTLVPCFL